MDLFASFLRVIYVGADSGSWGRKFKKLALTFAISAEALKNN